MAVFLLIVGLILFVSLVVIHEFGHFIMARRGGVDVEEFGIGFPPVLYRRRIKSAKGDYDFTINALPLGGFVRLKGEHDADREPGSYGRADLWTKTKIMVAGVFMNVVAAFVLLTFLALVGLPQLVDNQFTVHSDTKKVQHSQTSVQLHQVNPGSPAARAGLKPNDQITAIGPAGHTEAIYNDASMQAVTKKYAGRTVEIDYKRNNQATHATATLHTTKEVLASQSTKHPTGYLGVTLDEMISGYDVQRSTWSAPIVAGGVMVQYTVLTFQGLGHAIGGLGSIIAGLVTHNTAAREAGQSTASSQVSGPIGIFEILKTGSSLGYQFMLFVIAIISLSLAIMNFLPIPALDGGRLWFTLIAHALRRPLSQTAEEYINGIGFLVLIGLVILISIVDVRRFF